jgi:membrane protein DedA with SNARE-associated domain
MLHDLISRYGPLAIFSAAIFEGDATLILAGVSAHLGLFGMVEAVVASALGVFAGDGIFYLIGRGGAAAIRGSEAYRRVTPIIERLAARVGVGELVLARVVWGTRMASMVFWGVHGLPIARFAVVDLIGCSIWAALLVGLGFGLSTTAEALLGRVRAVERWLLGALVVAAALVVTVRAVARRLESRPPVA